MCRQARRSNTSCADSPMRMLPLSTSTHYMEDAERICDRVLLIDRGLMSGRKAGRTTRRPDPNENDVSRATPRRQVRSAAGDSRDFIARSGEDCHA
jgi:hypothetical protein